jgi:Phosphotransferase enzyme family
MSESVIPLTGGRMTSGVVKVADTVRRPAGPASPFVAQLLALYEQRGFLGAPRYLGQRDGMDCFSFIPGSVPARFQTWTDVQIAAAGRLLRAMHDASRGSALAGRHPVVCHHDPGPNNAVFNNMVFSEGEPVAFIDFDTAAPGSPLEDLGYLAWTWCVSSKPSAPPVEAQAAQMRIAVDAYGLAHGERGAVVDAILERQARNVRFWAEIRSGRSPTIATDEQIIERIAWSRREHWHTVVNREVFDAALSAPGRGRPAG